MAKKGNNSQKELKDVENAFTDLSDKKKGKFANKMQKSTPGLTVALIALVLVVVAAAGFLVFKTIGDNQIITAQLTISGVDVTGLTRKEATQLIKDKFRETYAADIVVTVDDVQVKIPYTVSQISLDASAAVNAACKYQQQVQENQVLDITGYIKLDKEAVMNALSAVSPDFTSTLKQTSVSVTGKAPEDLTKPDDKINQTMEITVGTPGLRLDLDAVYTVFLSVFNESSLQAQYTCPRTEPDALDLEKLFADNCIAPVEAEMDKEKFEVTGGTYGFGFDIDKLQKLLEKAKYGEVIKVDFEWLKPEQTAEELKALLFRDVLAEYSTHAGYNYDRNINLKLACEAINGKVMYPGDVFSYNGTLGQRTPEKGYRPGASYVGGETVLDYGGGICQVSSTLYYCTIVADLEIVERECHGYASSYTPLSTDATVFWNGIDFRFKNNMEYPIRIEAYSNGGSVTVRLYGTDERDYYVKFENQWLATYPFKTVYKEMKSDNEKGFKDGDVITDPYTGYKSQGFRAYYSKETDELIERKLESVDVYSSRDKVICKIIDKEPKPTDPPAEKPTDPPAEDTTQKPTDPPTQAHTTEPPTDPPTQAPTESETTDSQDGE